MIGRTLGNYRIVEQIGMGGMATVYKAYDPDTDRYVAVKVLPEHFSQDPTFRQRFEREAKAIAKLEHIHILPLFTYGEDDGTVYMVMRYLKAGSLTDRIQQGALSLGESGGLLNQIAGALDHAHAHGVLHRDVKPSNVLLDADGNAYLTDFGIAKMVESSVDLTGGGILGTPAYMSPEQCRGNTELTPASDQYSLGIILYEMITGRAPFQAETPIALIHMQLSDPLPMPRLIRPDLPEDAERVILKSLTKEPDLRYESCNVMAAAFAQAVANAPTAISPPTEDATLAAEKPAAVTSPVVDDATVLHDASPAAKKRRGLPWWASALIAFLVIGLGVLALGLILSGGDKEPATVAQEDAAVEVEEDTIHEDEEPEFDDNVSDLPELPQDYREVRPCDWEGHGPGLCIYGPDSDRPVRKLLQDEGLEGIMSSSWSPDGEEIIFSAMPEGGNPNGDFTLYRVRADGAELTKLRQISNDLYPDWSPDGSWFAFHSGCNLAIMHPDGSAPTTLWEHNVDWCAEQISWSPDSEAIVVSVVPTGEFRFPLERQIWIYSLEDAYLVQSTVFEDEECVHLEVAFSPNGEQVAYFDECQPMLIDIYGEGQPRPIGDFPHHWQGMAYPRWEGEMPELVELDDELLVEIGGTVVETCDDIEPPQICIREDETGQVYQVTHDLDFESIHVMSWSPDGTQIVFDGGWDDQRDLYIVHSDGSELRQLTDTEEHEVISIWSPTGEWIAFHRNCGLWLIRPDGSEEIMLREGSEELCVGAIGWSPDGRRLVFLDYSDTGRPPGEIWVIDVDGGGGRVIFELEPDIDPWTVTWDPSGQEVLFLYGLNDDQTHILLLDPRGEKEPKALNDDDFGDMNIWTWLPEFWQQWGGMVEMPESSSEEEERMAGEIPDDPWGHIFIPAGAAIPIAFAGTYAGEVEEMGTIQENGFWMAMEDRWEIKGFPVEPLIVDGGCMDMDLSMKTAQELSSQGVVGVIGHACSSACEASLPVYEESHLVTISPSCTRPDLTEQGVDVFSRVVIRDDWGGEEINLQPLDTPVFEEFATQYEAQHGGDLFASEMGIFAAYSHDAAVILLEAIKAVSVVDPEGNLVMGRRALAEAVRGTPGFPGVTGMIRFDENGDRISP